MPVFRSLARETTRDLLVRVRASAVAMLLLGAILGGALIRFWSVITGTGPAFERSLYGAAAGLPLLLAIIVYVYLTLGVLPALRGRFDSLTRSADEPDRF